MAATVCESIGLSDGRDARRVTGRPQLALDGVLAAIGSTPLIRLRRLLPDAGFELYAKLEALNPGGSMKDRPAMHILRQAIAAGQVKRGSVVVESSSGNFGIGLAQVCRYLGLRFVCVVDARTAAQNVAILRAYGAEVDVVHQPDPASGEYLPARLRRLRELLAQHSDSFWPNQYGSPDHPAAHRATMGEIVRQMRGRIDYLFCATGTCGTLRGCSEFLRARGLETTVVAVDAVGSAIFGDRPAPRLIPGHGAAVRPPLFREGLADVVVHVGDRDCVAGCRMLVRREALLAGGSSGAIVAAIQRLRSRISPGARCVALLPDRGERYLDTVYSDSWVAQHFGEVPEELAAEEAVTC